MVFNEADFSTAVIYMLHKYSHACVIQLPACINEVDIHHRMVQSFAFKTAIYDWFKKFKNEPLKSKTNGALGGI